MLEWILKITPMTEFEVINRFVDVDGTNKMIRDYRCMVDNKFFCYLFFLRIDLNLYK